MLSLSSDKFSAASSGTSASAKWPKVPSLEGVLRALAGVREDFVETLLLPQMSHKIGKFTQSTCRTMNLDYLCHPILILALIRILTIK